MISVPTPDKIIFHFHSKWDNDRGLRIKFWCPNYRGERWCKGHWLIREYPPAILLYNDDDPSASPGYCSKYTSCLAKALLIHRQHSMEIHPLEYLIKSFPEYTFKEVDFITTGLDIPL